MMIQRGDIWWADLGNPIGSEPGHKRPVLVIQNDKFSESKIKTVVCVSISSNLRLADAPGNIYLPKKKSRLSKDSVVNISQVVTLDKNMLTGIISTLNPRIMKQIDASLKLILSLR